MGFKGRVLSLAVAQIRYTWENIRKYVIGGTPAVKTKPNEHSSDYLGAPYPLAPPKYLNSKFKIQNSSPSFVLAFLLSLVALYIFRVLVAFCFCFFFLPFLWGFFFFSFPPLQTPQENIFRFGRTRKQLKRLPLLVRGRQRKLFPELSSSSIHLVC